MIDVTEQIFLLPYYENQIDFMLPQISNDVNMLWKKNSGLEGATAWSADDHTHTESVKNVLIFLIIIIIIIIIIITVEVSIKLKEM